MRNELRPIEEYSAENQIIISKMWLNHLENPRFVNIQTILIKMGEPILTPDEENNLSNEIFHQELLNIPTLLEEKS